MSSDPDRNNSNWHCTQYTHWIRYVPSGKYYARTRVRGKLIRKPLKCTSNSVGKLKLADLEKEARQKAEHQVPAEGGKLTFGEAVETYTVRLKGGVSLKRRTAGTTYCTLELWVNPRQTGLAFRVAAIRSVCDGKADFTDVGGLKK